MVFWSPSKKDKLYVFLKQTFGIKPKQFELYQQAFLHASHTQEPLKSNERLEFLGDAILDSVVAEYLYETYPVKDEGFLTKMKAKIVNRNALKLVANELGLAEFIKHQKGIENTALSGDVLEALIGAIYLDAGFKVAKQLIIDLLENNYSLSALEESDYDYKSLIYQWCQRERKTLNTLFQEGEDVAYVAKLFIDQIMIGTGGGRSKKTAEKNAAKNAWQSGILERLTDK